MKGMLVISIVLTLLGSTPSEAPKEELCSKSKSILSDTLKIKTALDLLEVNTDSVQLKQSLPKSIMHCPQVYKYDELGMFCKFDNQLDRGSKLKLRFRLGTLDAVSQKEGKGPTTTVIDQ